MKRVSYRMVYNKLDIEGVLMTVVGAFPTALRLWHGVFSRRVTQCLSDSAGFFLTSPFD